MALGGGGDGLACWIKLLRACLSCPIAPPAAPGGHGAQTLGGHFGAQPLRYTMGRKPLKRVQGEGLWVSPDWAPFGARRRAGSWVPHPCCLALPHRLWVLL